VESFGRLDLAFNNAGTPGHGTVTETAVADLDRILGVNLRGVFLCLKYEVEAMLRTQGAKAIVNCSSAAGHRGVPNKSAYAASKWGVVGLTKSAALDYADEGIRINAVSPGGIATSLLNQVQSEDARRVIESSTPMHRIATPGECADAVLWLLSEHSSYVTGTVINVDGGLSAGFAADAGRR
jgi:NAD(P)-dependent dehydrogenase (short-subunit alcohol dehydrogenase family)